MSILSTGTTTGTACSLTADTTGDCVIKTGSSATTAMTISGSTQAVTLAGSLVLGSSTLAAPSGSAPSYTCRAWGYVTWSGGTPTLQASGNVSSIVDDGTGNFTWNFTTAMPDANYSAVGSQGADTIWCRIGKDIKTTTQIRFGFANILNTAEVDPTTPTSMAIFR